MKGLRENPQFSEKISAELEASAQENVTLWKLTPEDKRDVRNGVLVNLITGAIRKLFYMTIAVMALALSLMFSQTNASDDIAKPVCAPVAISYPALKQGDRRKSRRTEKFC